MCLCIQMNLVFISGYLRWGFGTNCDHSTGEASWQGHSCWGIIHTCQGLPGCAICQATCWQSEILPSSIMGYSMGQWTGQQWLWWVTRKCCRKIASLPQKQSLIFSWWVWFFNGNSYGVITHLVSLSTSVYEELDEKKNGWGYWSVRIYVPVHGNILCYLWHNQSSLEKISLTTAVLLFLTGPYCPQSPSVMESDGYEPSCLPEGLTSSENCLHLNIYTPDTTDTLPVLFFIHGGGYIYGQFWLHWAYISTSS